METKQTETERAIVSESWRTVIRCKYHGPTNHRGSRITVARFESSAHGTDPNRITVGWDYSKNTGENYAAAVAEYVRRANWGGGGRVGTVTDGAVAVWVGNLDETTGGK